MDCIRYPDNVCKRYGKYYFQKDLGRGVIEVCCEKSESNIKIITILLGIKMEISYDKEADAIYIELRKGEFAKNKKVDGCTSIGLGQGGQYPRCRAVGS